MKRTIIINILIVGWVAMICPNGFAGVLWKGVYNGDVLPDQANPAWVHARAFGSSTVENGILRLDAENGFETWRLPAGTVYNGGGYVTFEIRMRVLKGVARFEVGSDIRLRRIMLGSNYIEDSMHPDGPRKFNIDTSQWHTYRLIKRDDFLAESYLYVDGDPISIMGVYYTPTSAYNWLKIWAWPGSLVEIDYVRYTDQGFHVPINRIIEEKCGSPGQLFLAGDLNRDCRVDLADIIDFASEWLSCYDPQGCQ